MDAESLLYLFKVGVLDVVAGIASLGAAVVLRTALGSAVEACATAGLTPDLREL